MPLDDNPFRIATPGLHADVTEAQYHDDPCPSPSLSSTVAKALLAQSPRHAWVMSRRLNPHYEPVVKDAFDMGHACHAAVLRRGGVVEVIDAPDWRKKDAQEARDAARAAGRVPLLKKDHDKVSPMIVVLRRRLRDIGVRIDPAFTEMPAFAEIDGVWCRALFDYLPDGDAYAYDYKTTEDASPEAVAKSIARYAYDVQASHYLQTLEAATGQRRKMRFIFQEKKPPFEVCIAQLHDEADDDADWMRAAAEKVAQARETWGECLRTDTWPGYPAAIHIVGAPVWHSRAWDQRGERVARERPSPEDIARCMHLQAP